MAEGKTKEKKEKIKYEDKTETYLRLSDEDLKILEVDKGKSTKETVAAIRKFLDLPEVFKNTKKQELIQKLGLERDATQKEINVAMLERVSEKKDVAPKK